MRSRVPVLLLGVLLFALMGAWISALIAQPTHAWMAANGAACGEHSPRHDAPADGPVGSSDPGVEDGVEDGDGDGDDDAHVSEHTLGLCPPLLPAGWLAPPPWSYTAFESEPSTPPPRA